MFLNYYPRTQRLRYLLEVCSNRRTAESVRESLLRDDGGEKKILYTVLPRDFI